MRNKYIRRRIVVAVLVIMFSWLVYGWLNNGTSAFTCSVNRVQVQHQDTLWRIAEDSCEGAIDAVVSILVDDYGTIIHAGQYIVLPSHNGGE